ncbi:MAG: hypothetical protein ACP5NZ_00310 [Nanobdellota archaeon]
MLVNYKNIDSRFMGEAHNYIVSYTGLMGEDRLMQMKAMNKKHAETKFRRKYNSRCKVTNVQTIDEWIDYTSTEAVKDAMEKVRYLEEELKEGKLLFG